MNKTTERYLAFFFGVGFLVALLVLAIFFPNPSPFQYFVFRSVLSLAASGFATMLPGFGGEVCEMASRNGCRGYLRDCLFSQPGRTTGDSQVTTIYKAPTTDRPTGAPAFGQSAFGSKDVIKAKPLALAVRP